MLGVEVPVPPATKVQVPVPGAAALPAIVAVLVQIVWSEPAAAVGAAARRVTIISSCVGEQGALVIVQRKKYVPALARPVIVVVAEVGVVMLGVEVPVPPATKVQAP